MGSAISPEEFRKLQIQVDILQRFLTKTFGSSFLEFCKSAQQALLLQEKSPAVIGKTQQSVSNGSHTSAKAETSASTKSNVARRPPPPLLHRPSTTTGNEVGTAGSSDVKIVAGNTEIQRMYNSAENDNGEEEEIYFEEEVEEEEEEVDLLQPETVFSDDDTNVSHKQSNSRAYTQNGAKRDHSEAFGYDESEYGQVGVNLPEGTDCIVIDSDEDQDQGQLENFVYQEDDESYADGNNDEIYEEGYGYDDNGMQLQTTESYRTEDVQTDGNVTFGTLVTAPDTGMQYFQCAFCPSPKVFKHKQSLKEHYLLNHSPTPPAFQCQCGRRFLKLSQLKRHEVVHTAERPFVCPICHKDFTRKDNMTVHIVRNHSEKKEKCPICPDKFYATTAEVNRHVRLYHSQWKQQ